MQKVISSLKVPLKGFRIQKISKRTKKIKGHKVTTKLTMPVSFKKGEQNPVKLKKSKNTGLALLKKAMNA